jgi:hypothetical protein
MRLNFVKHLFGWNECTTQPKEKCVFVFLHTSYWDMFIYMLYRISTYGYNTCVLVQPKLSKWYYKPLTSVCRCIFAPPNENKNSNSIQYIVDEVNKMNDMPQLCMSPKGTCSRREWRSGYYYIAKNMNCKIYPLSMNYSTRTVVIGEPVDPSIVDLDQSTKILQEQLSKHSALYNHLSETPINDVDFCPYESLLPFDFCAISAFSFLPCVFALFFNGHFYRGSISLLTTMFAVYYHLQREGCYYSHDKLCFFQKIEGYMAKICIISHIIENLYVYRRLDPVFYMSFIIGLFFYTNSIPRGSSKHRGKYAVFHSIYHILVGIAGYSLATQGV